MALACGVCGSDLVEAGVGDRAKCLGCGADVDQSTRAETRPGLEWTSEVPDRTLETAKRTVEAAEG